MKKMVLKDVSIARGIGIVAVVFFHSISKNNVINYMQEICRVFQMPLFFFLAGMVAIKVLQIDSGKKYVEFISGKFKRLMIPYFIFGIMMFVPKLILNDYAKIKIVPQNFLMDLFLKGNNPITFLWFLYVLFFIFVIYTRPLKKSLYGVLLVNILIEVILSVMGINIIALRISNIVYYANYFILGLGFRIKVYEKYRNINNTYKLVYTLISGIILCMSPILKINYIIAGIVGVSFVVVLSNIIENLKIGEFIERIGKYSYDIYLLSWFGQNIARVVLGQILMMNAWIVFITMFLGGLIVGTFSKYILRKNKFLNMIILGNFQ